MKLYDNWKEIIRKAWSIRFMALAIILSVIEAILPLFQEWMPIGVFATLSAISIAAAMIARVTAQQGL